MTKGLVVITGASSGIGKACAIVLSDAGYSLLLLGRRLKLMEALELPNCLCREADITDLDVIRAAIDEAEKKFGPVYGLINNAGVMLLGEVDSQCVSEWEKMIEVNVKGLLNGIAAVVGGMKKRNVGTILNISSIAGKKSFPNHTVYCGTKFAVHGISEALREELASSNIRVTTLAPGAVETELLGHTSSETIKKQYGEWKESMGGVLSADHIAEAAVFVLELPQNVCVREIVIAATRQMA